MDNENEELARCALANFENFESLFPLALKHPIYVMAKAQLSEALGEKTVEEYAKEFQTK